MNSSSRPDIVLLIADDLNLSVMEKSSCPHLRALAARGLSYRQAYNYGGETGAVCQSSRLQMLYGQPWDRLGQAGEPFPVRLQQAGYRTFATGKWHSGTDLFHRCFQDWDQVFFGGMMSRKSTISRPSPHKSHQLLDNYPGGLFSQCLSDYLSSRSPEDPPTLAYLGFTEPHDPLRMVDGYQDRNRPSLPDNFLPDHPFRFGYRKHRDEKLMRRPLNKEKLLKRLGKYMSMVSYLDSCVGDIIGSLVRPTVVIFTTDNGICLGSHGLLGKQNLYQESIHVPLSITGFNLTSNLLANSQSKTDTLVYLHDLYAAILDLGGVANPGPDYLLQMGPEPSPVRDHLTFRFRNDIRARLQDGKKVITYLKIGKRQVFSLSHNHNEYDEVSEVQSEI